jgi:large subunit ribosomal protein L25
MQVVSFTGTERSEMGKKGRRTAKKLGVIPAVIYGGTEKPQHFSVKINEVKGLIYTPDFKMGEVELGGSKVKCIVKSLQTHPVTDEIMHIDFLQMIDNHAFKAEVPIRFKGVSPGVKEGGKLSQFMRRAKIKTTPENMVDELYVDISELTLGNSVRVRDLEVSDKIEVLNNPATPIAIVEVPRALKAEEAAEEAAADAPAEGEAPAEEAAAAE